MAENWWSAFIPGASTITGGIAYLVAKRMWAGFKDAHDEDSRHEREDEREQKCWLSRQDARTRSVVDQSNEECDRLRKRLGIVEPDRDRGWDLARAWLDVAHAERSARNVLLTGAGHQALPPLPGLEEIVGRAP